jgi:hypothetical protein
MTEAASVQAFFSSNLLRMQLRRAVAAERAGRAVGAGGKCDGASVLALRSAVAAKGLLLFVATISAGTAIASGKRFVIGGAGSTIAFGFALLKGTFDFLHNLGGNFFIAHDVARQLLYRFRSVCTATFLVIVSNASYSKQKRKFLSIRHFSVAI